MQNVDLPAMLKNKKEIRLRPITERSAAILAYRVVLSVMLREIRAEFNAPVMPVYCAEKALTTDRESWLVSLQTALSHSQQRAIDKMSALLHRESESFMSRFVRSIKRGTGIDLAKIFGKKAPQSLMETYIAQNASLIKSLGADTAKKLEQVIYRAKLNNSPQWQVTAEIQRAFKTSRARAELIAVDQMASLNADLTAAQAKQADIKEYIWRGRLGSRERSLHVSLEGNRYKFDQCTGAESGLPPGKPVRCRCRAQMLIPAKSLAQRAAEAAVVIGGIATITTPSEANYE